MVVGYMTLIGRFLVPTFLLAQTTTALSEPTLEGSFYKDGRRKLDIKTIKINKGPQNTAKKQAVETYLKTHHKDYGLTSNLDQLKLAHKKESILGTHFHYKQHVQGKFISDGGISVSISHDGQVYRIYNHIKPLAPNIKPAKTMLSKDDAYDKVWQSLHVTGKLIHHPKATLEYVVRGKIPHPVYDIQLAVTEPYGFWKAKVDAITGTILSIRDDRIHLTNFKNEAVTPNKNKPLIDRQKAFSEFVSPTILSGPRTFVDGKGQVFDPDPRTSLGDATLEDNSHPMDFKEAYVQKTLPDVSYNGATYSLIGPWVSIEDFDPPNTAPTETRDGNWNFERGDNGFNDAMTYYHIDKSQRYLQSLGFAGDRGIQFGSIRVDANGANGADNSYFQPGSNTLAFGHGCVDDNEDADVILHEYGHAIHFSINSNWSGGDTGAIGEGFGDYWAGSYSYGSANGREFFPDNIFTWDGHSATGDCWPGRVMNATSLIYDPSRNYGAHSSMPGGHQTDELWSTPLFQSLKQLMAMDIPRSEVDQIIIESHFGLGSGVTMRELANSTVQAAMMLYPDGPHADVFTYNFAAQSILEIPTVKLSPMVTIVRSGSDQVVEPGETAIAVVAFQNLGTLDAQKVSAKLSSHTPGVDLSPNNLSWPDIAMGAMKDASDLLEIQVPGEVSCGDKVSIDLHTSYNKRRSQHQIALQTGNPIGANISVSPDSEIPDNSPMGITIPIDLGDSNFSVTKDFQVSIDIEHSYIGDLEVRLVSPSGKSIHLHKRSGGRTQNIKGTYPDTLKPSDSLSNLEGEPLGGKWQLKVADRASRDTGRVKSVGITDIVNYSCEDLSQFSSL